MFVGGDDVEGLDLAARAGSRPCFVEPHVLERVADTETPRGPVAVIDIPAAGTVRRDAVIIEVTDPGMPGRSSHGRSLRAGRGSGHGCRRTCGRQRCCGPPPGRTSDTIDRSRRSTRSRSPRWSRVGMVAVGTRLGVARDRPVGGARRLRSPRPPGAGANADRAGDDSDARSTESLNAAVAGAIVMYEMLRGACRSRDGSSRPAPRRITLDRFGTGTVRNYRAAAG